MSELIRLCYSGTAGRDTRTDTAPTKPTKVTSCGTGSLKLQTRSDVQPTAALHPTSETPWLVTSSGNEVFVFRADKPDFPPRRSLTHAKGDAE